MILGIGTDLVDITRVQDVLKRHGIRFLNRVFAQSERVYAPDHPRAASYYAKRFAAKEAAAKALGWGVAHGIYLRDIVVQKNAHGAPALLLLGGAAHRLGMMGAGQNTNVHVSLSDEHGHALAFVVIEVIYTPSTTPDPRPYL